MARQTLSAAKDPSRSPPVQRRSRERYERILGCAMAIMAEKGADALRMSDLVERTGIPFGSLYQYFPDKTAVVAALAHRYNAIGRGCVARDLSALRTAGDLYGVLCALTDSYYAFFVREPVVLHVWQATQADRTLQAIDEADGIYLTGLLIAALETAFPQSPPQARVSFAQVVMVLIAAAVRHAVTLPSEDAAPVLATFKRLLPRDMPLDADHAPTLKPL